MEWIFDGIGTEIFSLIVGALVGGGLGYKIGKNTKIKQSQIAGDGSEQKQQLHIDDDAVANNGKNETNIKQTQKAGANAKQTQVGRVNDDR